MEPGKQNRPALAEPLEDRRLLAAWGAYPKLIEQDAAASKYPSITGAGQAVAVIDTGVDYKHPALGGGFGPSYKVVAGYDFADNDADPMDEHGHGTGVAAAIAAKEYTYKGYKYRGVAPDAKIVALRVDDDSSDKVTNKRIESALQWVLANRTRYNIVSVNLSLGDGAYSSAVRLGPYGDELDRLFDAGVFIAAASGNDGVTAPPKISYPAAHPDVYAVGAVGARDEILKITERSGQLDLLAPGNKVPLPFYDVKNRKHIYARATGTSFATPFIAGAAALLKQVDPTVRPQDMIRILKDSGANNFDGDNEQGPTTRLTYKRLDLRRAVQLTYSRRDDKREQNDSLGQASALGVGSGTAHADGLKLTANDDDYFRFSIGANSRVRMTLTTSAGTAPRFELYSSGGSRIADLGRGLTRNLNAGNYVLKVDAGSVGLSAGYSISVSAEPIVVVVTDDAYEQNDSTSAAGSMDVASDGSSTRENLRLVGGDPDYFTFVISERMKATIDLSYAGSGKFPAGQLLDASSQSVASLGLGSTVRELAPGRYYLRFASSQTIPGTYAFKASVERLPDPEPEPEVIDARYLSSAFDDAGRLHVAFHDAAERRLLYQTRSPSGNWSDPRVIDDSANVGRYISLAVDRDGAVGIAYYDSTNRDLKFARESGSSFTVSTVDSGGAVGEFPSLAFDADGRPNIAYYDRNGGDLRVATFLGGGAWSIYDVDTAGDTGLYATLALDPLTQSLGVAYVNRTSDTVRYAENTGGNDWSLTTVTPAVGVPSSLSLAFDPQGRPAFSFQDEASADLKLAYRQSSGDIWSVHSIALDADYRNARVLFDGDRPSIFYHDLALDGVYEARLGPEAWTTIRHAAGGDDLAVARSPFGTTALIWRNAGEIDELFV